MLDPAPGSGTYPGTLTFDNLPALNPSAVDSAGTGPGLSSMPETFAQSTATDGTAEIDGKLTLDAPTSTPAGTYNGTITFSVSWDARTPNSRDNVLLSLAVAVRLSWCWGRGALHGDVVRVGVGGCRDVCAVYLDDDASRVAESDP